MEEFSNLRRRDAPTYIWEAVLPTFERHSNVGSKFSPSCVPPGLWACALALSEKYSIIAHIFIASRPDAAYCGKIFLYLDVSSILNPKGGHHHGCSLSHRAQSSDQTRILQTPLSPLHFLFVMVLHGLLIGPCWQGKGLQKKEGKEGYKGKGWTYNEKKQLFSSVVA